MASLPKDLRKQLENAVKSGRRVADSGARKALETLAVGHPEPWPSMKPDERTLRNRLRAHGRQLGDKVDAQKGTQAIAHLAAEVAYEHWHRILFARFLAENELLIEPDSQVAVSIEEVRELAREQGVDWIDLAASWALRMLPQIFRSGDPVLEITLPPEERHEVEEIVGSLPRRVFLADDSLGWVYQFWQAEKKDEVNQSGRKIGSDELPAVTQLFTEGYMVDFLLDNTLGAWWAGKKFAENPELARIAGDDHVAIEEELRGRVALPEVRWTYLRFKKQAAQSDEEPPEVEGMPPVLQTWAPAAGTFESWPKTTREITCLDPCMGSGHFIVAMFRRLVVLRMEEEGLEQKSAIASVIEQNLFGLEIDLRCTQLAAFNLALTAWSWAGYHTLPPMNLACSGLGINASEEDWTALAGHNGKGKEAMARLYALFSKAPYLGSLIEPLRVGSDLFSVSFNEVRASLQSAFEKEEDVSSPKHEIAVTAKGIVGATRTLVRTFTLVATNVPYLGRGKQDAALKEYCERLHGEAKADLSTTFIDRSLHWAVGGTVAVVTPQNWLNLGSYRRFRERLLNEVTWNAVARLGFGAFETVSGEVVNVALIIVSNDRAAPTASVIGADCADRRSAPMKAEALREQPLSFSSQRSLLANPGSRVVIGQAFGGATMLEQVAEVQEGLHTGDYPRFGRNFWELPELGAGWVAQEAASQDDGALAGGKEYALFWEGGEGALIHFVRERLASENVSSWIKGEEVWGRQGIAIGKMGGLRHTRYQGQPFTHGAFVVVPRNAADFPAIWCYADSGELSETARLLDSRVAIDRKALEHLPIDMQRWRNVAAERFPDGVPKPYTDDPTQWLFDGSVSLTRRSLQVACARLVGYAWPRQTGSTFPDCPSLGLDVLESHADVDGIVCLSSLKGEPAAADRLRALLTDAYSTLWSAARLNELLSQADYGGKSDEAWLRNGFFEQHCDLFHQRPFIWQIWDGVKDGFSALVNYHKLAARGEGRKTLEKLLYSYLGDWIERQRAEDERGVEGAEERLAAAEHLAAELQKILIGEPPYDIFVRWKPLHEQPIGWEPDINDGVRINIRPFMMAKPFKAKGKNACILRATPNIKWTKDRGKEPTRAQEEYPWFWNWDEQTENFVGGSEFDGNRWNDLHYTRAFKEAARARRLKG